MLTKSDYLKYTQCYKYLWLYKFRKDLLPEDLSAAVERVFDEGYNVESYAYELFLGGVDADDENLSKAITKTNELIKAGNKTIFQPTISENNLFCRADIIKFNNRTKKWDIYEVKSSTQIHDIHLLDLAFQKICFEEAKYKIGKLHVVHVNGDYVRQGEIEPAKFLSKTEVTAEVISLIRRVKLDIADAHKVLAQKDEPKIKILKQCHAPYSCHFLDYCWQHVPEDSIYSIAGGLSEEKLEMLIDQGIIKIEDIPEGVITHKRGMRHHQAIKTKQVYIDRDAIARELSQLKYPLYFLDYETNSPAVPLFDGYKPYQRIVFQYSLHVKRTPQAKMEHYAFLGNSFSDPSPELVKSLKKLISRKGSVIAWNRVFEMGCNKEMGERYRGCRQFMKSVNNRMYDLMNTFRHGYYIHKDFHGSASIKKVLPVLVPQLSYSKLNIHEGGAASEGWRVMIDPQTKKKESKKIYRDLLKYCRLDTLAMVRILKELNKIVKN